MRAAVVTSASRALVLVAAAVAVVLLELLHLVDDRAPGLGRQGVDLTPERRRRRRVGATGAGR